MDSVSLRSTHTHILFEGDAIWCKSSAGTDTGPARSLKQHLHRNNQVMLILSCLGNRNMRKEAKILNLKLKQADCCTNFAKQHDSKIVNEI